MNFFDTKKFSIRREVVKRFLEPDPSKQTIYDFSIETVKRSDMELQLLIYNYLLVVIFTPTQ